jgi:hypothetical protein
LSFDISGLDKMTLYSVSKERPFGQDRIQDVGGSSPVQEDGNQGKGW